MHTDSRNSFHSGSENIYLTSCLKLVVAVAAMQSPNSVSRLDDTTHRNKTSGQALAKGDLVCLRMGERLSEEAGVVQTVWRRSNQEPGEKHRTEVLVRFQEGGGGWFKIEDVERIGSTGKDPQPLWHTFPEAVRDVSEAMVQKQQNDDLTIMDILEGKVSEEKAAWMEVRRQRELNELKLNGNNEMKLFRAVMLDDVGTLQEIIMRMSVVNPVDVRKIYNSRGQTLLDLAIDRGKRACAGFLEDVYGMSQTDHRGQPQPLSPSMNAPGQSRTFAR